MTDNKPVLIGAFVSKDKILSYLEFLKKKFSMDLSKVYVYEIEDNTDEYIVTFRTKDKLKYLGVIKGAIVLHTKNGSLFSINALNKLIEQNSDIEDKKSFILDWDKYKDMFILISGGELNIKKLTKIEDKSRFLS